MLQDSWKRIPWQVILLLFTIPFLLRNLLLPMIADDYSYAFIWDGEHYGNLMDNIGPRERIDSFRDIIVSQWSHYFTWGGRTPAITCVQLFAWVGKGWFNVANTIAFISLMLVLYWLAIGRVVSPGRHKGVFLWVMLCMHFGVIDYPSTMLWMTGTCVYLWTGLWECLFLLLVLRGKRVNGLLIAVMGLLAGWSEEAGSIVTVMLTAFFLYRAWREHRLQRWMVVGFAALLTGCALLMLSPGNIHRAELDRLLCADYVLPADKIFSAEMFWTNFTEGLLPILLWESFLLIPIVVFFLKGYRELLPRVVPFLAGGLMVLVLMMFVPEYALRTGFHSTLFLTVASAAALRACSHGLWQALEVSRCWQRVARGLGLLVAAYWLLAIVGCFWVEVSLRRQSDSRMAYIEQHRHEPVIEVRAFHIPCDIDHILGPRSFTDFHLIYGADLEYYPTDNRSLMFARYYGLKAVKTDRDVDWKKYEDNE